MSSPDQSITFGAELRGIYPEGRIKIPEHQLSFFSVNKNNLRAAHEILEWVKSENLEAVIFDDSAFIPGGFSYHSIMLAVQIHDHLPVFFAQLETERAQTTVYGLWQYTATGPTCHGLTKIFDEPWGVYYSVDSGKKFNCSGGDSGLEDLSHALRSGSVVRERNWEKIVEVVVKSIPYGWHGRSLSANRTHP